MATFNIGVVNIYNQVKPLELTSELTLKNSPLKAIVDAKYHSILTNISNWQLEANRVISTKALWNGHPVKLHRLIMEFEGKLKDDLEVDHIDRNPLNNVISNLRMVTRLENARNRGKYEGKSSSKYIGVSWFGQTNKWRATIQNNYKRNYLGYFNSEEEAAHAYDEALANIPCDETLKVYNFPQ